MESPSQRSPFLTPSHTRRRRAAARRRRRLRRGLGSGIVLGVAIVGALIGTGALDNNPKDVAERLSARNAYARDGNAARSSDAHTAAGSPGATPPPLLLTFHHPPRAGVLFDLDTGRILWSFNATTVLPVASLTKMMTALLLAHEPSDAPVLVSRRAYDAPGSKVGVLPVGRRVPLGTLLYGLMLPSGNDAAIALAEHAAGSVGAFVHDMDRQARRMGLACTRFVSPDGIEDANRSCAQDLATLARADLAQASIARVAATAATVQPLPIKGGHVWLYNNNPLLRFGYPGAIGLKTGETEAAGRCLVGAAARDGVRLGVVLLGSPELGRQAEALLDAGFHDLYHQPLPPTPPVPVGM